MIRKLLLIMIRNLKVAATSLLIAHCSLLTPAFAAISTVDSQGGAYSSVKLQSNGKPAVAYFDHKSGELKYSYWTTNGTVNQWIRTVVEEKGVMGYVSLWLDSGNKPYISYYHNISKNNSTGTEISGQYGNHMVGALKYAYCSSVPCLTPEDWTKVTVTQLTQSNHEYAGGYSSLAFDSSGKPRIAYYDFSHQIDANDAMKGALKLAYCDAADCTVSANWSISTIDTDGGKSASMVIDGSDKVMLSYDADEVQKVRYAESSSPFSTWTRADIDTAVNTSNLFRDTSIAIHPTTGKPRLVYQYQGQDGLYSWSRWCCRGDGYIESSAAVSGQMNMSKRDAYFAYCDAADCTVSTNWTKYSLAGAARNNRGYTSSIKVGSDGKPRIAYHYWGSRAGGLAYHIDNLSQDLHYVVCGDGACDNNPVNTISTLDSTNNTGLYSSIVLDSSNDPLISYYDYDGNSLKLYHPTNSYTDAGITADAGASDTSNGGAGLQDGDTFKIIFSGSMNTSSCSITTANIDTILKLSNGHSWVCSGSTVDVSWGTTYNTNDTLTITVHSGTGGCVPTVTIGDRISIDGTCLKDASGNYVILQTEIKGDSGVKIPSGAIAYYKMDEGSKYTAYDSAGGHNASLNKGVTWASPGVAKSGYGVSLDGSDDHLSATDVPDIGGGKMTIEAWIKPTGGYYGTGYTVLNKENSYMLGSNGQCAIATTGTAWSWFGGGMMKRLQDDSSGYKDIWRHLVCTYDASTGLQKVYIDGIYDGERSASGNVQGSRYPFVMGRRESSTENLTEQGPGRWGGCIECGESFTNYTGINYYRGIMDEVVLYNTALSQTDILNRFKEFPAQLDRADANDTSMGGYGLQSGDTIKIRFTNETNAPTINVGNINTVLTLSTGSWLDGSNNLGTPAPTWSQTRFPNDTLTITLSTATSAPTVAPGSIITLSGGVIKDKTGTYSISGSTTIRGSYDLNGAVAYWKFNETSGTTASDSVGQYNHGTLKYTTTAPTWGAGKYNNAITFDGGANSQYVEVLNYPDLNPSNITVEAWVKSGASTWNTTATIASKRNAYILYPVSGTKNMTFGIYAGGSWRGISTPLFNGDAELNFDITQWHHYVGTYDGANIKLYVDGVLKGSLGYTGNDLNTLDTGVLTIGRDDENAAYLNGSIDEVVIYNRAITDDEVRKRSSARFKYAIAKDGGGGVGYQSGDKVVITFDAPTAGTSIGTISSSLALNGGHSWGTGTSAAWSTVNYTNDTLTITLGTGATVAVGDTITLGTTLLDTFNRALQGSIVIGGNFGDNFPTGRVASWNFDEQSGTLAHDYIGNNHGTLGNSTFWRTERIFKGLYFDGSRYVTVSDSTDFDLNSYTIDAYVKAPDGLTTTGQYRPIIQQNDGTNYWIMRLSNNRLQLCDSRLTMSSTGTTCNYTTATVSDGEWHHLTVVRDGDNNQVILYIDGEPLLTDGTTGGGTAHNIAAGIFIGKHYNDANYFYGFIDEIAVYNRALSSAEVQSRYRAPFKSAFTSDTLFNSGIQSGDKVIIRFHGKTNGYAIDTSNIGTNLTLSSSHTWGTISSAVWSTYKYTNDTLTITLGDRTGASLAGSDTITISGTSGIKDAYGNNISDSFALSKDFDFNLPNDAIAYWKLENNNDSFGTNNIASNTGVSGACKFGNCYTYGANQYATINNSTSLNPERITIEAWVNPGAYATTWNSGVSGTNVFFFYSGSSARLLGITGSATVRFNLYIDGAWRSLDYTPSSISGWHHYVGTYDGTTSRLYMDGVEVNTLAYTGVINQFDTAAFYLAEAATGYTPNISIDDVAIYSRALTAEEVLGRYGDYSVTARAYDTSGQGPGIQLGDTVTIKFSGPTNASGITASNIETALALSNAHYWREGCAPNEIQGAVWSSTGGYSNDTLTVTLKGVCSGLPDVAPGDTITIGSPIGGQYRAFTKSVRIGGSFGTSLPSGASAYWTFVEQSGLTAFDSIGNNHGTLNNSFWRTERASSVSNKIEGLYFDGSRYVDVPDSLDFDLNSYTIDAYVKAPDGLTTTGQYRPIIQQNDGTNYWIMRLNNNGLELCDKRLTMASTGTTCVKTATTVNDGEWHHLAVVHDDAADTVKLYIDGVALVTDTATVGGSAHNIASNVFIGKHYNGANYFYGLIDEIAVYNRALSEAEVRSRYRAPLKAAFTRDQYFASGIQAGNDKVIIRFHGKTNVATIIDNNNINTILPITGKPTGWAIQGNAVWSTYKFNNDTLTITLDTGATIAGGDTITTNGTYIKDMYLNAISESIILGGDFAINLPEGAVSYWTLDNESVSDTLKQNSLTSSGSPSAHYLPVYTNDFSSGSTGLTTGGGTFGGSGELSIMDSNNDSNWDTYVYTNATYARSTTKAFQARFKANSGVNAMIGWHDGAGSSYTDLVYAIYFNNSTFQIYEKGAQIVANAGSYTVGAYYDVRIELKSTGAKYYYKATSSTTWTLLYDSNNYTDTNLRVGIAHYNYNAYSYVDNLVVEGDTTTACKINDCYSFGSSQYASINNSTSLNTERLSVEAWVRNNLFSTWNEDVYFFKGGDTFAQLYGTMGAKTVNFRVYVDGAWKTASYTPSDITGWHHYVGTYDGTNVKLYIDGALVGTFSYTGVINQHVTDTGTFYIGANGTGYAPHISIDDMVVYNRALTLEEVIGRYGEYSTSPFYITAFAKGNPPTDTGIDAGDALEIRFPGPTNGGAVDASNIDNFLTPGLHTWKDGSNQITSAVWSNRVYENDTLTITLSATTSAPTVAPQDTISMGGAGEIGARYRAVSSWSANISGTFGEALPGTPVAFWKMDENIGNIAFDSVGTYDGTLFGTTLPAWATGMFNYGLDFNSSTAYMNVGNITLSGDWSIEGWFKAPLPSVAGSYISLTGDRRVVVQKSTMKLGTYNGAAFVDLDTPYLMSGLSAGWHHIAAVGSGASTLFYIDGALVGTASYKTTAALTTVGNTTAGNEQFGLIDELAVYSSALTADDVGSRYLVFLKTIYAKDTTRGGSGIQNGDQIIIRFDGRTNATAINQGNISAALQLSSGSWGTITSADWSTTYKTNDTLTITLQTDSTITTNPRTTITLGGTIQDFYNKTISGSMQIGGDFGTNLPDGAVAYWKMDESSGTNASDSFNDNDGAFGNTPTWTTSGRFNNALQFTGGTGADADYVSVTSSTSLDLIKEGTVEAWVYSTASQTSKAIISRNNATCNTSNYLIYITGTSNQIQGCIGNGTANNATSTFTLTNSAWTHVAMTWDGSQVKLYINGQLNGSPTTQTITPAVNTTPLYISGIGGANNFNGNIDDVVIYNRALTAAEIRTRYGSWFSSVTANDASGKGPNIQANDTVVIRFTGETNGYPITKDNIDAILSTGKTWLDGNGNLGTPEPTWSNAGGYTNDTLTITLSGPPTYIDTAPAKPTVVVGDTININGAIKDTSERVIRDSMTIGNHFGESAYLPTPISSAVANDASNKGPNIQSGDTVVITFAGATNQPAINNTNINTILPLNNGHSWIGSDNIVNATWNSATQLTITLSGPVEYLDTAPTRPTVIVGDTITVDGTITDSSGKAIIGSVAITNNFGVTSSSTLNTAVAYDTSNKGPNIQAGDTVVIKFNGATNAPTINASTINTILPVSTVGGQYRKPITITGSTAGAQTNYQVLVTVDTASLITEGKMQSTGADIRFTNSSGASIPYWIESGINTATTKIWVKVDSIPASPGTATIYMYYGNLSASAASSGTNTFEFFDDFSSNTWTYSESGTAFSGTWASDSYTSASNSYKISHPGGSSAGNYGRYTKTVNVGTGTRRMRASVRDDYTGATSGYHKEQIYVGGTSYYNTDVAGGTTAWGDTGWLDISAKTGSQSVYFQIYEQAGTSIGINVWWDDMIVRKYASPEPTAGTPGAEENGSGHSWLDGDGALGGTGLGVWTTTTNTNDTLTITLSGPPTYSGSTPAKPTVVVGDIITINGRITDLTGKPIVSEKAITNSFGTASSVVLSSATADDNSTWGPNIQSGDRVVISFNGATNQPAINAGNIDTILQVKNGATVKSWVAGDNNVTATWTSASQLIITLSGPATQQDAAPTPPTVAPGDTIWIDGTITDTLATPQLIISSVAIGGDFGASSGTGMQKAWASDDSGQYRTQAGDKVVITFNGQIGRTGDPAPTINAGNIDAVLAVSGKTWLDGNVGIGSVEWTTVTNQNDTLTITLSDNGTPPSNRVAVGDTINLGANSIIKDKYRISIGGTIAITGDFGRPNSAKAEWKFDEGTGTATNDNIRGYNDNISGTGYWVGASAGRFGNGLKFDAVNEYVTVGTQYDLTSSWTIEAWVLLPITKIGTQQKFTLISSNSTSNENQIIIEEQTKFLGTSNGNQYYYAQNAGQNYTMKNLTNGWHHVAAVGTGGTTTFYIDGEYVGTASYKSASHIKYLGNTYDGSRPMSNTIDNIVVYNEALSATTIKNRYGSWPRSAYAEGTAGDITGIQTGDRVVITFDQATEGNSITSANIGTALQLSSSHIWGSNTTAVWSTNTYTNDTLTITLSTTGTTPTVAKNDTITLTGVIKDLNGGRPISDTITLLGSFDFKLPSGAIAFWRFNETSGAAVNDSFGNNNGTLSGTRDDAMYGTKGVTIDTNTEYVSLASPINMPATWTIIGWVKTPIYGTADNALIHGAATEHEHAICIHTGTGNAEVGNVSTLNAPGGSLERGTGYFMNTSLKPGWHHIAAVGTGGDGLDGTTTYYVDGQPIGEAVLSGDGSKYKAYTTIESLGNNTGSGGHYINTTIDEISVYNRALSATEIRQYYGARLKYARAKDASAGGFGIDAGDQVVIRFDGETNGPTIDAGNIDTVLKLSNGHTWKDGNGQIGTAVWSNAGGYTNDTLTITLSTYLTTTPTVTNRDTITLDGTTIKELIYGRNITGSIDISGDFDGVAAYYDLDDAVGSTATDSVNGNNGTLGGSTLPSWGNGYSGSALNFNDTNAQYVTIPDSASFNLTNYTIEAWVKVPTSIPTNYMRIVSQETDTGSTVDYWSLAINPSGQLVMCDNLSSLPAMTNNNVGGSPLPYPPYPAGEYDMGGLPAGQNPKCETVTTKMLNDDKWHFVAVVRDVTGSGNFKFYIDHGNCASPPCVPDKTVAGGAGSGAHNIAGTVEIGRKSGFDSNISSYEYFRGKIDNIAIYNYALTDAEINAHHFLYPTDAWAAGSSVSGINAGDSITIIFNGETGATAINDLTTLNNALKLPTGKLWGNFGSAAWSQTSYPNDTLKVTLGSGANMAVGDTITLGNVILDVHNNPISGEIAITGSFDVDVPIGAIAYWPFDENIGTNVYDQVGSYDGSIYGGAGNEWVAGKFGTALDLTGSTKYVSLTNGVALTSDEWTIEAWFYGQLPTNLDGYNTLLTEKNPGTQQVILVNNSRQLGIYSTTDGGGFRSSGYSGIDSLLSTQWHHLVAVGKKVGGQGRTYFYIDGNAAGTYSAFQSSASIDKIGNGRNAAAEFKRPWGKIDDIVIYNRALSAAEISARAAR